MSAMDVVDDAAPAAEKEEILDLRAPAVVDRYRAAGTTAQNALQGALSKLVPGAAIADVCEFADALIDTLCAQAFKTKGAAGKGGSAGGASGAVEEKSKGVAFPTCISVNECLSHCSPFKTDKLPPIAAGDMVKIELGVHVEGYIATVAATVVVGEAGAAPVAVTGPRADVLAAAHAAAEAAVRLIKPGNTNAQVTEAVAAVAAAYGVTPAQGVLMHQMKRMLIDGTQTILLRGDDPEIKVEDVTFELNQVWSIDVVMSTGDGKPRESETRTTVFKLVPECSYKAKSKASAALQREAMAKSAFLPFTLRAVGAEATARLGIVELVNHGVVAPYPVLFERGAELAHVNATVLLLPGGTLKIAGAPPLPASVTSDKVLPDSLKALLATVPYASKKAKEAAEKAAAAGGAPA